VAWRYGGIVQYIEAQAGRLGLSQVQADRARHNPEIHRAGVLLGQLADRYRRAPKEGGVAAIGAAERAQVAGTLAECSKESDKLHALAATAEAMLAEAYAAFGLGPPARPFRVRSDFEDLPEPPDLSLIPLKPRKK
jgi:hypothetical protein